MAQFEFTVLVKHTTGTRLNYQFVCVSCSVMSDSATPWTVACQAPLSMKFSRQEYWSGLPLPSPVITVKSQKAYSCIYWFYILLLTSAENWADDVVSHINSKKLTLRLTA